MSSGYVEVGSGRDFARLISQRLRGEATPVGFLPPSRVLQFEPDEDPEIALMAHVLAVMNTLAPDAQQRIRQWVDERFVPRRGDRA